MTTVLGLLGVGLGLINKPRKMIYHEVLMRKARALTGLQI
jgi:hypothetical protein